MIRDELFWETFTKEKEIHSHVKKRRERKWEEWEASKGIMFQLKYESRKRILIEQHFIKVDFWQHLLFQC